MRVKKFFFQLVYEKKWPLTWQSFFLGQFVFLLKMTSLYHLLGGGGIGAYPFFMIAQGIALGIIFAPLYKFITGQKWARSTLQILGPLFAGLLILTPFFYHKLSTVLAVLEPLKNTPLGLFRENSGLLVFSWLVFSFCSLMVLWLESLFSSNQKKYSNTFQNPLSRQSMNWFYELGILFSACVLLSLYSFVPDKKMLTLFVSAWVSFLTITVMLLQWVHAYCARACVSEVSNYNEIENSPNDKLLVNGDAPLDEAKNSQSLWGKFDVHRFPFVLPMLFLIFVIFSSKNIQNLGVLMGLSDWTKEGKSFLQTFFILTLIQQALILCFNYQGAFIHSKSLKRDWSFYLKSFFAIQTFSMLVLLVSGRPMFYFATGVGRKLFQHTLLNPAFDYFERGIPRPWRTHLRNNHHFFGLASAQFFVGIFSLLAIHGPVPNLILWLGGISFGLLGIAATGHLFYRFNQFLIGQISNRPSSERIESMMLLAHPKASIHRQALVQMLNLMEKPIEVKATLDSLGQMRQEDILGPIKAFYEKTNRFDIKAKAVESVQFIDGYQVDLFYRQILRRFPQQLAQVELSAGHHLANIFTTIAKRMERQVIALCMECMEYWQDSPRELALTIKIFSGVLHKLKRWELLVCLRPYLYYKGPDLPLNFYDKVDPNTIKEKLIEKEMQLRGRRVEASAVRAQAIMALFPISEERVAAQEQLESFLTSKEFGERVWALSMIVKLGLPEYLPNILNFYKELIRDFEQGQEAVFVAELLQSLLLFGGAEIFQNSQERPGPLQIYAQIPSEKILASIVKVESIELRFAFYWEFCKSRKMTLPELFTILSSLPRTTAEDLMALSDEIWRETYLKDRIKKVLPDPQNSDGVEDKEQKLPLAENGERAA